MPARYSLLYFLKPRVRKDGKQLVFLRVSLPNGGRKTPDGKYLSPPRISISTGLAIDPKYFDKPKQRARAVYPHATVFNAELERLKNQVTQLLTTAFALGKDPAKALLEELKPQRKETGFIAFVESFIESRKAVDKAGSIQNYGATLKDLKAFELENKLFLEFNSINSEFGEKFAAFLLKKGNSNNTIQKKLSFVKTFANDALQKELHESQAFRKIKDSQFDSETTHVALSRAEIAKILVFDPENERLQKIKDCFLFMVFTGLRYSDLSQLRPHHCQTNPLGEKYLSITITKTEKPLTIGLNKFALEIWERYEAELPKITNQRFNEYLKELCQKAGIDTTCETSTSKGSERIVTLCPKYELVTAHTARRTYASLSDEMGVSLTNIQKSLGHHDTSQTEQYLKRTALERATETVNIWNEIDF